MNNLLAIITPAKNESANVSDLVKSVCEQSLIPDLWIFVNDSSTDDTEKRFREEVGLYSDFVNKCDIQIVKHSYGRNEYALGNKYSRVVNYGMQFLKEYETINGSAFNYVGVLDCDVFPERLYYEKLIGKMRMNDKIGIAAGGTHFEFYPDGRYFTTICSQTHAPGGCRVWRKNCLDQTGYFISISQDSVSEARAIMLGWQVRSFSDISVRMRKRGGKSSFRYYGESEYIRWIPSWYFYLKAAKLYIKGHHQSAKDYVYGYSRAKQENLPRLTDPLAKKYYRYRLYYKLIGK